MKKATVLSILRLTRKEDSIIMMRIASQDLKSEATKLGIHIHNLEN